MKRKIAFVDEFGTNSFDFTTHSTHFIVSAVIIDKEKQTQATQQINEIITKYFPDGEMKSAKVGKNDTKRLEILNELLKIDFKIFALVVDKRKLYGLGFKYKKPFYKYLFKLLYTELHKAMDVDMCASTHDKKSFMREFATYLEKNYIVSTLFTEQTFTFENSVASPLLQLSNFISGTFARIYDTHKKSVNSPKFENLLAQKVKIIKYFPDESPILEYAPDKEDEYFNHDIANTSVRRITDFIERKQHSKEEEELDQVAFLSLLLTYLRVDIRKSVPTKEIMKHLMEDKEKGKGEHYFRSEIIAKIRDAGILIASSQKGYKIPVCEKDIYEFVNHSNTMIINMLKRVKKAQEMIMLATDDDIDILQKDEYSLLKKAIGIL